MCDVSVVVPVMNEAENVEPLIAEIQQAFAKDKARRYEIVYVDDGSTDTTLDVLRRLRSTVTVLRVVVHEQNSGQSAAIRSGARAARGRLIVTLDGDAQNDPADIPALLAAYDEGADPALRMVAGQRRKRQDSFAKRWASRWANRIRQWALNDQTRDTGCGLKVFSREAFFELPYFDHMHRFLPALMQRQGYAVKLVDVNHRHRLRGQSKYGVLDRALVSISDLLGVMWLRRRCRLPGATTELE